jgi:hypothetical protein
MVSALIDRLIGLTALLESESEALALGTSTDRRALVTRKRQMMGEIRAEVARLERRDADWLAQLERDTRDDVFELIQSLFDAALINAQVLDECAGEESREFGMPGLAVGALRLNS